LGGSRTARGCTRWCHGPWWWWPSCAAAAPCPGGCGGTSALRTSVVSRSASAPGAGGGRRGPVHQVGRALQKAYRRAGRPPVRPRVCRVRVFRPGFDPQHRRPLGQRRLDLLGRAAPAARLLAVPDRDQQVAVAHQGAAGLLIGAVAQRPVGPAAVVAAPAVVDEPPLRLGQQRPVPGELRRVGLEIQRERVGRKRQGDVQARTGRPRRLGQQQVGPRRQAGQADQAHAVAHVGDRSERFAGLQRREHPAQGLEDLRRPRRKRGVVRINAAVSDTGHPEGRTGSHGREDGPGGLGHRGGSLDEVPAAIAQPHCTTRAPPLGSPCGRVRLPGGVAPGTAAAGARPAPARRPAGRRGLVQSRPAARQAVMTNRSGPTGCGGHAVCA